MRKSMYVLLYLVFFGFISVVISTTGYATDGMNMEGYGPIATGMGGASMAYDNGTAAMMNNPATLGLMPEGNRLDVALGYLGPHVKASAGGASATSSGNAYYMPAFGWAKKSGQMTYGLGMFAQGGMGTEYASDSFMAATSGEKVRSEVSVGRLLVPFAYDIDKNLTVAASLDYVWAGMDLKMAMNQAQFMDLAFGSHNFGVATGPLVSNFGAFGLPLNYARFDFSNSSAFTGAATGAGFAGKVGGVYKINNELSIGVTYHSKTSLSDLETTKAKVSMNVDASGMGMSARQSLELKGKIQVKDFEWPQMAGVGAAYQASDKLLIVADYKWINWADVMKSFKMTFTADQSDSNNMSAAFGGAPAADFRGQFIDATLYQKWKDQHVIEIGAGYKVSTEWTLRAGLNIANNPIPDTYLNALFPAIEKNHVTLGAGYMISKASSVDASFTYAPEVKQNGDSGVTSTHSQTNMQVMYSYRF